MDQPGNVGSFTSITVTPAGLPLISYLDEIAEDLTVAHCNNTACTSSSTSQIETEGSDGEHTAITIGADGLPLVVHAVEGGGALRATHCSNDFCLPHFTRR